MCSGDVLVISVVEMHWRCVGVHYISAEYIFYSVDRHH